MSADLRRHIAYFGPREKVYANSSKAEIPNMPPNWRRILAQSYPFPIIGPFGNVYSDMEHALIAFRYLYASSCPHYSELFRMEHDAFSKSKTCRRFGSSNGLSLLQTDPDDRVWYIIRDKCMFDVVYQRICRDVKYRSVLRELVRRRYLPVYHVRTADTTTYWGATMNKDLLKYTNKSGVPSTQNEENDMLESLATMATSHNFETNPSSILIGKNRLGEIMVHAYNIYKEVHDLGVTVRNVTPGDEGYPLPCIPTTPIHPDIMSDHSKRARDAALAAQLESKPNHNKKQRKQTQAPPPVAPPPPTPAQQPPNNNHQENIIEEILGEPYDGDELTEEPFYLTEEMLADINIDI